MKLLLILLLILLNGFLSMAEIALISIKRSKLRKLLDEGNENAQIVFKLTENPNRLFSTIQVGITLIGILTGALSGVTLSQPLANYFVSIGLPVQIGTTLAFLFIVIITTYISIVIGELVPKRIGLQYAERISLWVAKPMNIISTTFGQIVTLLSNSTDILLRILGIKHTKQATISGEEVKMLIQEGAQTGVFGKAERNILEQAINLADIKVSSLMTARNKIIGIDENMPIEKIKHIVLTNQFSYYPVYKNDVDNIIGIISHNAILTELFSKQPSIKKYIMKAPLIPENKKVFSVLELFKRSRVHTGLIVDEYGNIQGLIHISDILEALVGDLPEVNEREEVKIIKRSTNSWLVDGLLSINEFKEYFDIESLPNEQTGGFNTVGGFVMDVLGKVPVSSDRYVLEPYKIEVMDMDGNRVDKVMVTKLRE
ncbi:MAG TPA: hemolysin family protein [Candidatus Woesebacteria bacterium]|nr:hemolysin family protein [Candidatus Woesebacteria bacterium]